MLQAEGGRYGTTDLVLTMWHLNILGIKSLRGNVLATAYMVVCGVAFIMFGYDQAVLGALSGNPSFLETMGVVLSDYDWGITADQPLDKRSSYYRMCRRQILHRCHTRLHFHPCLWLSIRSAVADL